MEPTTPLGLPKKINIMLPEGEKSTGRFCERHSHQIPTLPGKRYEMKEVEIQGKDGKVTKAFSCPKCFVIVK